jgi:CelD/BcsL family acetyltransferase involved in cellulose biosynthesis
MIASNVPLQKEPTAAGHALSLRIFGSFAEVEHLRGAWNELVLRSGADVYQTFDWCSIWWDHYGSGRKLHLLVFSQGTELVGVLPAFTEVLWLGLVRLHVSKLVGADYSLTLCNLPVLADHLSSIVLSATRYFLGQLKCDALLLGPISGPKANIESILATGTRDTVNVRSAVSLGTACNTYFSLPASFEDYFKGLEKKQRSNFKRMVEQCSKARRCAFDVVASPELGQVEFEDFRQQHERQWQADGKLGHFGDWPHSRSFNQALVRTLSRQGMVRFFRILADDQVVCSQYCFVHGHTNYWRLPARIRSPEWDRLSLGSVGLVKMIEASIAEGVRTIEGGRGHYAYKVHHGGTEWPLRTIQFVRVGATTAARVRLTRLFASVLDLTYYKVMFMRVAPRVRRLQGPLSHTWIRSAW